MYATLEFERTKFKSIRTHKDDYVLSVFERWKEGGWTSTSQEGDWNDAIPAPRVRDGSSTMGVHSRGTTVLDLRGLSQKWKRNQVGYVSTFERLERIGKRSCKIPPRRPSCGPLMGLLYNRGRSEKQTSPKGEGDVLLDNSIVRNEYISTGSCESSPDTIQPTEGEHHERHRH